MSSFIYITIMLSFIYYLCHYFMYYHIYLHLFAINIILLILMKYLSSTVYAIIYVFALSEMIILCSDIILSRYSSVAISFVYQTISRHAAHVALSFVSQYRSVTMLFAYFHQKDFSQDRYLCESWLLL